MEAEVGRWARRAAAERGMSVARFVVEIVRERRERQERNYDRAMQHFLSFQPRPLKQTDAAYPDRTDLHNRKA